jgi:hypothetical protein
MVGDGAPLERALTSAWWHPPPVPPTRATEQSSVGLEDLLREEFAEESRSPGRLHTVESQGTPCAMVTIDQIPAKDWLHYLAMKVTEKQALAVRCPTCRAKPGEKCELSTGLPRTEPHRDRRLVASDK